MAKGGTQHHHDPNKGKGPQGPPAFPPLEFGRYQVQREVGRGRFSVVYRAIDPRDHAAIALKVLYPALAERSLAECRRMVAHEADRLRMLKNPHIVGVHESGEADGLPYIAFPFVRGIGFHQVLSAATLKRAEILAILETITRAVHHAHQKGLIHRDLKPQNFLVDPDNKPYVLDFGLAWKVGTRAGDDQHIVGTPTYMSPEQARGEEQALTPASDVFSLGAILYEALTGRPPFHGETPWKIMQHTMNSKPPAPRELRDSIGVDLERVILWCLEKEPLDRYRTALALAEDLKRIEKKQTPKGPGFWGRLFSQKF